MDVSHIATVRVYEIVFSEKCYFLDPASGREDDPLSDSENDTSGKKCITSQVNIETHPKSGLKDADINEESQQ